MTPPEEKKERLKNCPFCGDSVELSEKFAYPEIQCPSCKCVMVRYLKEALIKDWNTRHSEKKVSVDNIFALLFNKRKSQGTFPTMEEIKILENYSESIADYVNGGGKHKI